MKRKNRDTAIDLRDKLNRIMVEAQELEQWYRKQLDKVHPNYQLSASNLLYYKALRSHDLRQMQKQLRNLGLSRLANAESHVSSNVLTNKALLKALMNNKPIKKRRPAFSSKKGIKMQKRNAKDLLGFRSKGRRSRIMVTLPSHAADDPKLVLDMVKAGMNCARINGAHDTVDDWIRMCSNVRAAAKKLNNHCSVTFDLSGPKIRTGPMEDGPRIMKIRTKKNVRGFVVGGTPLWLGPELPRKQDLKHVPVAPFNYAHLKSGDELYLIDTRGKKRTLVVKHVDLEGLETRCFKTTYVETGMRIYDDVDCTRPLTEIGLIKPVEDYIMIHEGSFLQLNKQQRPGQKALYDSEGRILVPSQISCTAPEVFDEVREGDKVQFDDGRITGIIRNMLNDHFIIEITHAKQGGVKLRADKGINFPDSNLHIKGLTEKDRKDLEFAVQYADVINMSFVNDKYDVSDLFVRLEELNALGNIGVILKIETKAGYNNLIEIILEGMRTYPLGIMIARGDLAVEVGWDNIARVQEEILSICQAAHIPDIWATQVLENLAKTGLPSRAEISDAVLAQRADCIMLNKGPYILDAIKFLSSILRDMKNYYDNSVPMTPAMANLSELA